MAAITDTDGELKQLNRYGRYVYILIAVLLAVGVAVLAFVLFGRLVLPPVIDIEPERLRPFAGPVCPGDVAEATTITYVINRPSVLLIDAVIYDLEEKRAIPTTERDTSARPSPYVVRESRPITFTAPDMPPGKYEWHVAVSTRGELARTAFWFIEFEIKENCEPTPMPLPAEEPPP